MATTTEAIADAPYAEWREQLAPWLDALRAVDIKIPLPALPTVSDIEELWIHVKTPHGDANKRRGWTPFIESLELMELLARVDPRAAWYLLLELTGQQHVLTQYEALLLGPTALPKFVVNVKDRVYFDEYTFPGLTRLIVKSWSKNTATYALLKSKLEAKWAEQHGGEAFDRERLGRVKLSIDFEILVRFDTDVAITAALEPIIQLAYVHFKPSSLEETTSPAAGRGSPSAPQEASEEAVPSAESAPVKRIERGALTMDSFRYNLEFSMPAVTNLVFYLVNQAAKFITISHVAIARVHREQLHHSTIGDFLLNLLLPWKRRPEDRGMESLQLDPTTLDTGALRAFCSAIAASQVLREFTLSENFLSNRLPHEVEPHIWWPWLVYALFSRETTHEIRSVHLRMDLLGEGRHPGRPRDVLNCLNPLAYLLRSTPEVVNEESEPVTQPMTATFRERAPIRIRRIVETDDDEAKLTVPDASVGFRITRNEQEEDFVEFLLPGVGICWTGRSNVLDLTPVKQRESHPVRHLTLDSVFDEPAVQYAIDLLEAVGEPIEWLTLLDFEGPVSRLLDAVAAFCPNLKRLDLTTCYTDSLSWLAEPHDGLFNLETLCIDDPAVDDLSSCSHLLNALKDPSHPLAQSLRQLHLGGFGPRFTSTDEVFTQAMSVLEQNRHLTRCELWTDDPAMLSKYSAAVLAHHGDYIPEEEAPLTPAQKIAFLGVITQTQTASDGCNSPERKQAKRSGSDEASARFKLNPELAKLVFDLAATAKARVCGIQLKPLNPQS